MISTAEYIPEPRYETADADCIGGPLDGQRMPVQGLYIRGPFLGRYELRTVAYLAPNSELVMAYRYEYNIAWKPK